MKTSIKNALLSSFALAFSIGAVQAADLPPPPAAKVMAPAPIEQVNWGGFYLGGHFGYGKAYYKGIFGDFPLNFGDLDLDGIAGGGQIGFNHQETDFFGPGQHLILGIEGDISFTDFKDSITGAVTTTTITGDVDLLASIRARLGMTFDNLMIYATGGIAFANADATTQYFGGAVFKSNLNATGGVLGGGFEYMAFNGVSVGAEGLYYFFSEKDDLSGNPGGNAGDSVKFDDAYVIRVRVNVFLSDLFDG